jgi:hypothetical protein
VGSLITLASDEPNQKDLRKIKKRNRVKMEFEIHVGPCWPLNAPSQAGSDSDYYSHCLVYFPKGAQKERKGHMILGATKRQYDKFKGRGKGGRERE